MLAPSSALAWVAPAKRPSTRALYRWSPTVASCDVTTTISLTGLGPRSRSSRSVSARFASGLFVKSNPVVRASPNRVIARIVATASATTHTSTVRHGCLALLSASDSGEKNEARGTLPFQLLVPSMPIRSGPVSSGPALLSRLRWEVLSRSPPASLPVLERSDNQTGEGFFDLGRVLA